MRYLSITGFYPDEIQDSSLQFEMDINGSEMNEKVAQLIESKPLGAWRVVIEPGSSKRIGSPSERQLPEGSGVFHGHLCAALIRRSETNKKPRPVT